MIAKSSPGTMNSAIGVWKKKTYQDRLSWAGVVRKRATSAAWCGTAITTSFEKRSGRWPTATYAAIAPQSWPMSTASRSPASSSASASASSATAAVW